MRIGIEARRGARAARRPAAVLLAAAMVLGLAPSGALAQAGQPAAGATTMCQFIIQRPHLWMYSSIFESSSDLAAIEAEWRQFVLKKYGTYGTTPHTSCKQYRHRGEAATEAGYYASWVEWRPTAMPGPKRSARIFFKSPNPSLQQTGFAGATVDIEYQLIACFGELHLAYSLVVGSVAQQTPVYFSQGRNWKLATPPPQVGSVDLQAIVTDAPGQIVGTLHDKIAGKALGFGCYSGQTKKLANLSDHLGPNPTNQQVTAFMDRLSVRFFTDGLLQSSDAEREVRALNVNNPVEIRKREKAADAFITSLGKP